MKEKAKQKKKMLYLATLGIVALLIGVIIAGTLVWRDHLGNRAEAAALAGQIAEINQKIKDTPGPPEDLEARLEKARDGLDAAENAIPAVIKRNDVVDYIIDLGEECQVEAIPLVVEGWVTEGDYSALRLNVTVTGRLDGVTDFIAALEDSQYRSLTIGGLSLTCLDPTGGSAGFGDATPVAAGMNIAVYTYSSPTLKEMTS
jgi:hypothetical protein